ncbi:hypothetical protein SAMN05444408_1084 [Chryseobacterium takakiae]|jgi:GH35 family endo-1,4-beta-xylanase|uniref:Integrase core domain-containing protein n=1 Tax=Chryseobacterium takakiae TaxID=1302685 RepID=A0A1M4YGH9_9FLAO|nr:hypothetical protein SAMN05444408_1084 [Chryseobacterium takakiae]
MDISQYKSLCNITFYIYTVVDNFSRKILSWDIFYQEMLEDQNENRKASHQE